MHHRWPWFGHGAGVGGGSGPTLGTNLLPRPNHGGRLGQASTKDQLSKICNPPISDSQVVPPSWGGGANTDSMMNTKLKIPQPSDNQVVLPSWGANTS